MPLAEAMLSNAVSSNSIGRSNAGPPADAMYNAQCGNAHAELQLKLSFGNTKSCWREIQFFHIHLKTQKDLEVEFTFSCPDFSETALYLPLSLKTGRQRLFTF